jgi:hypothetical protein
VGCPGQPIYKEVKKPTGRTSALAFSIEMKKTHLQKTATAMPRDRFRAYFRLPRNSLGQGYNPAQRLVFSLWQIIIST